MKLIYKVPLLLLLSSALLLCASCGEDEAKTSAETAEAVTEAPSGGVHIAAGEKTDYMVIRGDTSENAVTQAAVRLRTTLAEHTADGPGITTDWEKNPVYPHELIVGPTTREGDAGIDRIALGETGYVIREENGCVYLCGGSGKGTTLAVQYFLDNFVSSDGSVDVPAGFEYVVYHEYDIPALYINMTPVESGAVIAVPNLQDRTWRQAAEQLQNSLYRKTGVYADIVEGTEGTFVLSGEPTAYAGADEITLNDSKTGLVFRSDTRGGVAGCTDSFIREYLNGRYGCFNFPADFHYLQPGDGIIVRYPEEG